MRALAALSVPFRRPELKLQSIQNLMRCLTTLRGARRLQVTNATYIYAKATLVSRSTVCIGTVVVQNRSWRNQQRLKPKGFSYFA